MHVVIFSHFCENANAKFDFLNITNYWTAHMDDTDSQELLKRIDVIFMKRNKSDLAFNIFESRGYMKRELVGVITDKDLLDSVAFFYKNPSVDTFNNVLSHDSEMFTPDVREEHIEMQYNTFIGETHEDKYKRMIVLKERMETPQFKKYAGVKMSDPNLLIWAYAAACAFPWLIADCNYPLYLDRAYRYHENYLRKELALKEISIMKNTDVRLVEQYFIESILIFYASGNLVRLFQQMCVLVNLGYRQKVAELTRQCEYYCYYSTMDHIERAALIVKQLIEQL